MKGILLIMLPALLIAGCGDSSPFDEDYWDQTEGNERDEQADPNDGRFSVILTPVSSIGFGSGSATIDLNGNQAVLTLQMRDVPANIVQANITSVQEDCTSIISNPATTGTTETRDWTFTENGTRAALFDDLGPGETVEFRSLVIFAFAEGNETAPASPLFPLACGEIQRPDSGTGADPNAPGTGTVGGGVTGGGGTVTGGTAVGGAIGGTAAGTTVGGGVDGGVAGGVAGGGVTTTGGVGGTPGGVTTTGGVGTATGGVGGTPGGVTTTGGGVF